MQVLSLNAPYFPPCISVWISGILLWLKAKHLLAFWFLTALTSPTLYTLGRRAVLTKHQSSSNSWHCTASFSRIPSIPITDTFSNKHVHHRHCKILGLLKMIQQKNFKLDNHRLFINALNANISKHFKLVTANHQENMVNTYIYKQSFSSNLKGSSDSVCLS